MNKREFLSALEKKLSRLPIRDGKERINFYSEIIDDKIEEGLTEEQAVLEIGSIDQILSQIIAETPLANFAMEKIKPKRKLSDLEIVLLVVASPIWFSLLISAFAVVFSLYVALWAVVISLWAVFVSLVAGGIGGILAGVLFLFSEKVISGLCLIGAGLVLLGLSIFSFFAVKLLTKASLMFVEKFVLNIKKSCVKEAE